MSDSRFEVETPFSDDEIAHIEDTIGRQLPTDYLSFVREYGGAFVGGLVDGSDELPILRFLSPDAESGVLAKLHTHTDLRDDGVLPFADCELGNLYVLRGDDTVHYINYYGGETKAVEVGKSFTEFLSKIVVVDE